MDLIDKQEVRLVESDADSYPQEWNDDYEKGFCDAIHKVLELPTVDAQPVKRGMWERTDMFVKCSECGVELLDEAFFGIHVFDDGYMPFCPNCSSKMNGVDAK